MLQRFRNISIQWKLVTLVAVTSTVSGLVSSAAFVSYQMQLYRAAVSANLSTIAQILAQSCRGAVAFDDSRAALTSLRALEREPHISGAAIYGKAGQVFAHYSRTGETAQPSKTTPADGIRFEADGLSVAYEISLERERIGTVYLKRDLSDKDAELRRYAVVAVVVLIVSLMVAVLASLVLQKLISRPILRLAEAAGQVSRDNNYDIRVEKTAQDELGALVDRFNEMLGQIHSRDEALKTAKDKLEDRVVERTLELQAEIAERESVQRDLVSAKEAAEASNKAKSAFLATMSHELRTPLNAIIGYSEMLQEDAEESFPEAAHDLQRINRAGRLLLELINNVLDVSKIEASKMQLHPEKVNIGEVLDEVIATAEPLIKKNSNWLVVDCSEQETCLYMDPLKFRQSLLNLLSNAAKFTKGGAITLRVNKVMERGQQWIDWAVTDTGIGIAADQIGKLFCSFSQVDDSAARSHSGTGLGLAISKGLCELMGGTIFVETELGVGSTFTIRLPLTEGLPVSKQEDEFSQQLVRLGISTQQTSEEALILVPNGQPGSQGDSC